MKTDDFDYQLPADRIAHFPPKNRTDSRLMVVNKALSHQQFSDLPSLLTADDLLVINNTKVIAARLYGRKATGGAVEILIERPLDEYCALAHIKSSRSPKAFAILNLSKDRDNDRSTDYSVEVLARKGSLFEIAFSHPLLSILDDIGHMPLPPYIDRADAALDQLRYQTVFAETAGAVAAPTAGLHFDDALLQTIKSMGIQIAEVTLHVGAGTFQPVKVNDVSAHQMHAEWLSVSQSVCDAIKSTRAKGGRVIAVGTTVVRALESASVSGSIAPFEGETRIFIYPGYVFRSVDAMITNFHLPKSTLLMLVSAFSGKERILSAYQAAIDAHYRFFSYGDAMMLSPSTVIEG